MTEIAAVFNSVGVGIGLLVILIAGVIGIISYLVAINIKIAKETAETLKLKDAERLEERKQFEEELKALNSKSNEVYQQLAKSNQNIADALTCLKLSLETMIQKFNIHDERAININDGIKEIRLRVENCGRNRK